MASETSGTWGKAKEVPGTAALNTGGGAAVESVSCASAGNCAAGGFYTDSSGHDQAFVVNEVSGIWRPAEEVPGTATITNSVSCASPGNCSAGGVYIDSSRNGQAFVVNEVSGIWRTATEVPGTPTLNKGGRAQVLSVSCTSAGNCSAGGLYTDSSALQQAFVVNEVSGIWRTAKEVPGTATLNTGGDAAVESVSCAAASSCSAAGGYFDSSRHLQVFVVNKS